MLNMTAVYSRLLIFFLLISLQPVDVHKYLPEWESLDKRPLPQWYNDAKFGIFIHWGVFSVPAYGSEWFWQHWQGDKKANYVQFVEKNYKPGWTYADFARDFTTEFYNPDEWAELFESSGAKYVVLTAKHHEGYTNWPSNVSFNWNSKAVGPNKDLVGMLADSIRRKTNIHFGLYHSLYEWFHPLYLMDQANKFKTNYFVKSKTMPELYELVNTYKPEVVWSDGDWGTGPDYWESKKFIAWLYNDSPVRDSVVTNDRWGVGTMCQHGGVFTCQDRYNPGVIQKHRFENALNIDKNSFGYRREADLSQYLTIEELIKTLAMTVSCNGNLLMNIGPRKDGKISPIYEERLRQMGAWLKVNGEAIYNTQPWKRANDTVSNDIWFTAKEKTVYGILLKWPKTNNLQLGMIQPIQETQVTMLGYQKTLHWQKRGLGGGISIEMPNIPLPLLPNPYAWVLKFEKL
ncbi:DgyrCDS12114 [Dimorphilus gyrociliatus]|uniref:alpha-L-fucosidase n=1 Tax=Dimorphilus gyrociliatus TaxID=2664684 RepID=A0A7I8W7C6_9ANNE|nr:DgyrCDS12114 [Dimorphilus gyrociliatus]